MSFDIAVLPGDGIGPEVVGEATRLLQWIDDRDPELHLELSEYVVGGASIDRRDDPLPADVLEACQNADGILLGAVGGPRWDDLPVNKRPEQALLGIRKECELFANLRPAKVFPELVDSSPLKNDIAARTDFLIVRELTGGVYFSLPRGIDGTGNMRRGYNTMAYSAREVDRIVEVAVRSVRERDGRLTSVDKANVLEVSKLWRETVVDSVPEDIELNHLYVDNAAMQLIRDPGQFDVIVTGNLFGDILSDEAAQICGSIGLLPSACLGSSRLGMYEPVHGSAPDIAGEGKANPLATLLSVALMFRYSLERNDWAERIERAVSEVISQGKRTHDIVKEGETPISTREMGDAVIDQLETQPVEVG